MAARKDLRHSDGVRDKIRTSQLVNRLMGHVNGTVELSPSQVTAGLGLLKKAIPDLAAVTLSGDPDNPVQAVTRIELVTMSGNGKRKD